MTEPLGYRKTAAYETWKLVGAAALLATVISAVAVGVIASSSDLLSTYHHGVLAGGVTLLGLALAGTLYAGYKIHQNRKQPFFDAKDVEDLQEGRDYKWIPGRKPEARQPEPVNRENPSAEPQPAPAVNPADAIHNEELAAAASLQQHFKDEILAPRIEQFRGFVHAVYGKANEKAAIDKAVDQLEEAVIASSAPRFEEAARCGSEEERNAKIEELTKQLDEGLAILPRSFSSIPTDQFGKIRNCVGLFGKKVREGIREAIVPIIASYFAPGQGALAAFKDTPLETAMNAFIPLATEFVIALAKNAGQKEGNKWHPKLLDAADIAIRTPREAMQKLIQEPLA